MREREISYLFEIIYIIRGIQYMVYTIRYILYVIEKYRVYVRFYARALRGWRDIRREQESEYYLKAGWPRKWVHNMVLK